MNIRLPPTLMYTGMMETNPAPANHSVLSSCQKWISWITPLLIPAWGVGYLGKHSIFFDIISNFKLQLLYTAIFVFSLHLLFKCWKSLLWSSPLLLILAIEISVWSIPPENLSTNKGSLKAYLANVLGSNQQHQLLLDQIHTHKPDLVALLEINQAWANSLLNLSETYPHSNVIVREDNFGIAIFSKYELMESETLYFSKIRIPSVYAKIYPSESTVINLLVTHPIPPIRRQAFVSRNRSLKHMGEFLSKISGPKILLGDLNTAMWSPFYRKMEQTAGLYNARKGFGVSPTWPASAPTKIPLDHGLLSPDLHNHSFKILDDIGSDHLPLIIEIHY